MCKYDKFYTKICALNQFFKKLGQNYANIPDLSKLVRQKV